MAENTAVAKVAQQSEGLISPFSSGSSFETAQRMAKCLASSTIVPDAFRGQPGLANAMIAIELAARLNVSVMQIMQNLYVIHGRPAFSSQFIIAAIQSCGRYSALKYDICRDADGSPVGCIAYATELSTGERLESPEITMQMAKDEGWLSKSGSKWKTMPEVMLRYRAASAFGRLYAPDVLMGFRSQEEAEDMANAVPVPPPKTDKLNELLDAAEAGQPEEKPFPKSARDILNAEIEDAETVSEGENK